MGRNHMERVPWDDTVADTRLFVWPTHINDMMLTVHVKPNARKSRTTKRLDDTTIVVSLAAPAHEGKANEALIEFLAEEYGVSKSRVRIVRGATARIKHVEII